MKELDILFERFISAHSAELAAGDWPELESLLQNEDDQLWDWLQDPSIASAHAYRHLLTSIREKHA